MRSVTGSLKFLLVGLMGLAGSALGQDREPLTLPLAVEVAMRSHPLVRVAGAGREMAAAQVDEARGA